MIQWFQRSRAAWLGIGALAGLALGGFWPQAPLHSVATDRQENFAIATGIVDSDVEAVYTLDFLTGELSAAVLNPSTRLFAAGYKRNITADLGVETGKSPKYLMVSGLAELRGGGQTQFGSSVLYVAELTSGKLGVYAISNANAAATGRAGTGQPIILLQVVPFRSAAVR
jgi:hypothetical protein